MDDGPDEFETQPTHKRTTVAEAGVTRPAGAKSSAFDVRGDGKTTKPRKPCVVDLPDPAKVVVRYDVPIPPIRVDGRPASVYETILAGIKKNGCVELTEPQAASLVARARKKKVKVLKRSIEGGKALVWRL